MWKFSHRKFSLLWHKFPRLWLQVIIWWFSFKKKNLFFRKSCCAISFSHQHCRRNPVSLQPHQHLAVLLFFLFLVTLIDMKWYLVILIYISLLASHAEHLFLVFFSFLLPDIDPLQWSISLSPWLIF